MRTFAIAALTVGLLATGGALIAAAPVPDTATVAPVTPESQSVTVADDVAAPETPTREPFAATPEAAETATQPAPVPVAEVAPVDVAPVTVAPAPAAEVAPVTAAPAPTVVLPPCASEDSTDCYWNAATMGNGTGTSFIDVGGVTFYPAP